MNSSLKKLLGRSYIETDLQKYGPVVNQIRKEEKDLRHKSDLELGVLAANLRNNLHTSRTQEDILVGAYALASEAAARALGMRPFDVQIMGALALSTGCVVEMQTGEGKTLTATLPAFYHALNGRGVHLHTFNDYLAKRDAQWMQPVYELLGVSVGYIQSDMAGNERRKAYERDVVYLIAKEGGFDYLRTLLIDDTASRVQRKAGFAIVDEVDSILIDEARIPLVVAGDFGETELIDRYRIAGIVRKLRRGAALMWPLFTLYFLVKRMSRRKKD